MGIFHLGGSGGPGDPVIAADVSFNNDASGLDATDVQAAIDEVVDEQFTVTPRTWEATDWLTLSSGTGAPSSSSGGPGWYYLDTTSGSEELYGPASFDPGIPGWDWGSPLANFVFSATGPTSEAGDWYVWDENGDGSEYVLFQKKTTVNHNDFIRSQSGTAWEAVTPKISGQDVYVDLGSIEPGFGVQNVQSELFNLESYSTRTYGGYWSDQIVDTVQGTYELPVGFANNFLITLDGNTTLDLPTDMNAAVGYSGNLANKSSEVSVIIVQGSAGPYTLTWGTMISQPNSGITLTNHADEADWFKLITFDNGTTWFLSRVGHRYDV
jgi:hypothetical protein